MERLAAPELARLGVKESTLRTADEKVAPRRGGAQRLAGPAPSRRGASPAWSRRSLAWSGSSTPTVRHSAEYGQDAVDETARAGARNRPRPDSGLAYENRVQARRPGAGRSPLSLRACTTATSPGPGGVGL